MVSASLMGVGQGGGGGGEGRVTSGDGGWW